MAIITLTTDFGLADGYVGIMKGVILGIARGVELVDLSHEIPPQDVREAIYLLESATPYFPDGTIHLAVVDPGVGSSRRPLLVQTQRARYVGPDNGLFTRPLSELDAQSWELDRPEFWLPRVSRTFHGRDIFAPVAAHLANGVPTERLGHPISDPIRLALVRPARQPDGRVEGQVVHVDRFGNLITDIPAEWVADGRWLCHVGREVTTGLSGTYADATPGALVALVSSSDTVEIAERDGNAARRLGVKAGDAVRMWRQEEDFPWKGLSSKAAIP